MKHVVTGGAGFIGSNLVDELIGQGHEVVVIDNLSTGAKENINPKAELVTADISKCNKGSDTGIMSLVSSKTGGRPTREQIQRSWVEDAMKGADSVFHLAALARVQPSIENPALFDRINVGGTLNMLDIAASQGVRRFIFSSSSSVYGDVEEGQLPTSEDNSMNPMSPYALNKLIGEEYCKLYSRIYNLETVCLRYFNVYGERQPLEGAYTLVMGAFAKLRLDGKLLTINGDGEQRRDFTYVKDVAQANILASGSQNVGAGEVINIGNGDNRSVNDIAALIGGETVSRPPVIEPKETLADNSRARTLLGWKPTIDLEDWMPKYKKDLGLE
jgi:UDP-glucose 4-epimerase